MIRKIIRGVYYYTLGHILAINRYDRKYLSGPDFQGKLNGLCSRGWEIVVHDAIMCKKNGVNTNVRWPVSPRSTVVGSKNIEFDPDDLHNFQVPGCYFQGIGKIVIGKGTYIAPNVGMITANHDFYNLDDHSEPKPIYIGRNCWIGMNTVILPGVQLGDRTIVGAGAVVNHSFPEGNVVIGGVPAKVLKSL